MAHIYEKQRLEQILRQKKTNELPAKPCVKLVGESLNAKVGVFLPYTDLPTVSNF